MDDRVLGGGILLASVIGILVYFWLVFLSPPVWQLLIIQLSAFLAVTAVLFIVAWIGYTLATTPPPEPFESLDEEITKTKETESETPEKEK